MDPAAIAPMVVTIVFIVTTGGVLLLRPIAQQLAGYLKVLTEQKKVPAAGADVARLQEAIGRIEDRLGQLEERQQFSDELLRGRESAPRLASPPREE